MTQIYLIRHCEGMGNVKKIFNGTTDCDVSERGATQLPYLTKRFKDIHLDAVYSSPLKRTTKTALAVVGDKELQIKYNNKLIELYGGMVEGKPFAETFASIEGLADIWNNHPQDFHPLYGESMRHAYERAKEVVLEIAAENRGKTVAAATHGGLLRCLFARLVYGGIENLASVPWCDNTDVALLRVSDDDEIEVVFHHDHSHLPDGFINKETKVGGFVKG